MSYIIFILSCIIVIALTYHIKLGSWLEITSQRYKNAKELFKNFEPYVVKPPYGNDIKIYVDQYEQSDILERQKFHEYMHSLSIEDIDITFMVIDKNRAVYKDFINKANKLSRDTDEKDYKRYRKSRDKIRSSERYSLEIDRIIKEYAKSQMVTNWNVKIIYKKQGNKELHRTFNLDDIKKWRREH